MARRLLWPLVAAMAIVGCSKSPQPPQQSPSPGERITGNERVGWTQQATDSVELADFKYAIYVDGARSQLADVACSTTSTSAGFDCSAPLPKMSPGAHTLEVAAYIESGTVLESPRSSPLQVIVSPTVAASSQPASVGPIRDGLLLSTTDGVRLRVDVVGRGLEAPTDLAFAPDGRLFVAERSGRIRVVRAGELRASAAVSLADTAAGHSELLALAIDPKFEATHFVYAIYTTPGREGGPAFSLARFREARDTLADRVVLVDEIPAASPRAAASMRFGPDGKLYVALDDGGLPATAGDLASFNGKILRMNADGTTPDDQAGGTPVFSYEYRSPRGFDWQPASASLWIVDGAADGATRLSAIDTGTRRPRRSSIVATYALPSLAGASAVAFYRGDRMPAFRGDLFVASDEGRHILRLRFDPRDPGRVATTERLLQDQVGRVLAVAVAPDGTLYFCTSHELARIAPDR